LLLRNLHLRGLLQQKISDACFQYLFRCQRARDVLGILAVGQGGAKHDFKVGGMGQGKLNISVAGVQQSLLRAATFGSLAIKCPI